MQWYRHGIAITIASHRKIIRTNAKFLSVKTQHVDGMGTRTGLNPFGIKRFS